MLYFNIALYRKYNQGGVKLINLYYYYMFCFGIFGLMIGSFLNVCIFRIPKGETIVTIPSHCTSCNHKLSWYDLFPLFSYLFLGGKCRYCKAKISPQYPLIEFLNMVLWVSVYCLNGGLNPMTIVYCCFFSALLVLSVIDIREGIVPDRINLFIFVLGIIAVVLDLNSWASHIIGAFVISVPLLIPLFIKGMGGGDLKLFAAAGFFVGWKLNLVAFILACLIGAVYCIFIVIKNKATGKTAVRFVPFIAAGFYIAVFWGESLIEWYVSKFIMI